MRILKFGLHAYKIRDPYSLVVPKGSVLLHCFKQEDLPTLWFACPDDAESEERTFHLLYTGDEFPLGKITYLNTIHIYDDKIVLHIFEEQPNANSQ